MSKETFERKKPDLRPGKPIPNNPKPPKGNLVEGTNTGFILPFDGDDAEEFAFAVFATPPLGEGTMSISKSKHRFLGSKLNTGLVGELDFTEAYTSRYGNVEIGNKIGLIVKAINTVSGKTSVFYSGSFMVTAEAI